MPPAATDAAIAVAANGASAELVGRRRDAHRYDAETVHTEIVPDRAEIDTGYAIAASITDPELRDALARMIAVGLAKGRPLREAQHYRTTAGGSPHELT